MSTAIATREQSTGGALAMWNDEQIDIIKRLICPDATDTELALFGQVCQRTGLDPFAKQIYGIKRKGRLTIQTGIDGFRLTAQRSREYAGQEGPQWCGEDGVWRDVWLSKEHPAAARVGVYRTGWTRPVWGVAIWNEYAQYYNGKPGDLWAGQPSNMLAKCAEAQALRKAFPAELSGVYGKEEMDQADGERVIDVAQIPNPKIAAEDLDDESFGPVPSNWTPMAEDKWATGVRAANEVSADIPEKPGAAASRAEISAALRKMGENVVRAREAREHARLIDELREVIAAAEAAGIDFYEVPADVDLMTNEDIREMIVSVQQSIPTEPAVA